MKSLAVIIIYLVSDGLYHLT